MTTAAATATKTKWGVDTTHSEVHFKVKHLVISTVTGSFKSFTGSMESNSESDFDQAAVTFELDVNSIDTNQSDRDNHLKSPDFFDAAQYPTISFKGVLVKEGDDYALKGDITMRGVTKEITFAVEHGGVTTDPWGNTRAGFELSGKLNRKAFGLNWHALTEAGGVVVADEVKLLANVEVVKA